jgi:maleylpyruvate isomerase
VQRPATQIEAVRAATARLLRSLDGMSDEQAAEPSRLPGWTRAEVATHLARNADGLRGMVEAAARGEVERMYPSAEARTADITAGRGTGATAVCADVRGAHERLIEAWDALPDGAWEREGRTLTVARTMRDFVDMRLREVEIHHVDLGLGYEPSDWPVHFVADLLEMIFATMPQRAAAGRPPVDAAYRVVSTDHERAWRVDLHGGRVDVRADGDRVVQVDGEASGWGCDVAAWLYGRDPRGGGVLATGDLDVLRLPRWFPFG